MEEAIGINKLISKFDNSRAKLKRNINSDMYKNEYKNIVAQLEVVILPKYKELKSKLKVIQKEALDNSLTLNMIPKDRSEYDKIIHQLKLLQIIRKELEI